METFGERGREEWRAEECRAERTEEWTGAHKGQSGGERAAVERTRGEDRKGVRVPDLRVFGV